MNFEHYLSWSREVVSADAGLRRYGETRIAAAYSALRPVVEVPAVPARVHRCDLARQWCALQGWPAAWSARALVCEGVRHALELLLRRFARRAMRLTLPGDVYPVYWQIAAAAGVGTVPVETFPHFDLAAVLFAAERAGSTAVVLPAPLKLQGRAWTAAEVDIALAWLRHDPTRRLILDGVYAFGQPADATVQRLLGSGQAILLDSLSKGWLHPRQFGIALLPECEMADCAAAFRQLELSQAQLFGAQQLLDRHVGFPQRLAAELAARRQAFLAEARAGGLPVMDSANGYLVAIHRASVDLLRSQRLLAIPASVFGSAHADWSLASVLPTPAP